MTLSIRPISELLSDMQASIQAENISVGWVLEKFHERGFGFFLLVFILPLALPVPKPPGLSTILVIPVMVLALQQALGRHTIWMPEKIKHRTLPRKTVTGMIEFSLPAARKIETLLKPRLGLVTQGVFSHVIGILGLIMACFIAIPLPLTNTVPAWGIALMALGVMMRDGIAVLAGAIIGTGWMIFLTFITLFLGAEGIDFLKEIFKSFL